MNKQNIISIKNLTKKYGNHVAIKDISFDIKAGERIGIIGANGAGKTTLTEIIAGVTKPTSGKVDYLFEYKKSPKEFTGMQFQDSSYPSGLTVKDIVKFANNVRKLSLSSKEIKKLLSSFQMERFYSRKARSLSGGQRQKLNILLAVMHNPKFIILDEISTGLDVAARDEIINFTDNLLTSKNISALVISHHMAEIKELCDKVIVLNEGVIEEVVTIANIEKKYGNLHDYLKTIIKKKNDDNRTTDIELKKRKSVK